MAEQGKRSMAEQIQLTISRKCFGIPLGALTVRRQGTVRTATAEIIRIIQGVDLPPVCPDCKAVMRKEIEEPSDLGMPFTGKCIIWRCDCKPEEEAGSDQDAEAPKAEAGEDQ